MAYVSISKDLLADVKHKIHTMQSKQIEQVAFPAASLSVYPDDPIALELIWGSYLHLKAQIPDAWCTTASTLRLQANSVAADGSTFQSSFDVVVAGSSKFRVPQGIASGYSSINIGVAEDYPLLTERVAYNKQIKAITSEWKKISDSVLKYMQSAKSLNEAIKLWPAIALYVPEQYLIRVESKAKKTEVTMSAAQAMLANLDTDSITAAAVVSRMSV